MKPVDRSLEIMVVGLGQAGSNIAAEFHRRGHRALALNTATTDLDALDPGGVYPALPAERRLYIGLEGYDGAGADPSYGAECIAAHEDVVRSTILEQAADADAILISAGLGGGTGSAANELIGVLKNSDIPIMGLFTLPTESESALAKVNTVRAINDLVDAPLSAWIFIDNSRVETLNHDIAVVDYYAHVNELLAEPLDALNRLNTREDITVIRSFDGEDLRKVLLSGGVLNYGVIELPNITVDEVAGAFVDCLEASDLMPSGFDPATVSYIGLVIEGPHTVLEATPISVFEAIDERLKAETGGAAIYRGIYQTESETTKLRMVAATRSLPHRIRELLAAAREEGSALQEKLQEQLPTLELGDIEGFELFRPEARNRASERPRRAPRRPAPALDGVKLDAVRGKPAAAAPAPSPAPRRRPNRVKRNASRVPPPPPLEDDAADQTISKPMVNPVAANLDEALVAAQDVLSEVGSSSLMDDRLPDAETSEFDLEAQMRAQKMLNRARKPAPPPPPLDGGDAGPELYDKLVSDYLHADDDVDRGAIADRLESDSVSPDTSIRYYAVDAMSKLGHRYFSDALLAASEDDNEAVRTLALEALKR